MYLKFKRQQKHLSQEQLAERCKLSLRTVQRVEAGHRVGYASLRAIAVEFDIDADVLERELYAMKDHTEEYKELPLWVRIYLGSGWRAASRQTYHQAERGMLILAILLCVAFFLVPNKVFPLLELTVKDLLLFGAFSQFAGAYMISIGIRVGDKYDAWTAVESTLPRGLFGFKHTN